MLVTKFTTNNAVYNVQELHLYYNHLMKYLKFHYKSF